VRDRFIRRIALNAKPGIGAMIKERRHALRIPRRAATHSPISNTEQSFDVHTTQRQQAASSVCCALASRVRP
jgi:hypothetical protein